MCQSMQRSYAAHCHCLSYRFLLISGSSKFVLISSPIVWRMNCIVLLLLYLIIIYCYRIFYVSCYRIPYRCINSINGRILIMNGTR
jgi:hypothetical protein